MRNNDSINTGAATRNYHRGDDCIFIGSGEYDRAGGHFEANSGLGRDSQSRPTAYSLNFRQLGSQDSLPGSRPRQEPLHLRGFQQLGETVHLALEGLGFQNSFDV